MEVDWRGTAVVEVFVVNVEVGNKCERYSGRGLWWKAVRGGGDCCGRLWSDGEGLTMRAG